MVMALEHGVVLGVIAAGWIGAALATPDRVDSEKGKPSLMFAVVVLEFSFFFLLGRWL